MGYQGFKAVQAAAKASGATDPGAVAASVGRKKYGAERFNKAAASGRKMKGMPVKSDRSLDR